MSLRSLNKVCGKNHIKGLPIQLEYAGLEDIQLFPRTKLELEASNTAYTPAAGDSKRLAEEFLFVPGKNWLSINILVNSGDIQDLVEGEVGGQGVMNKLLFTIEGSNPQHNEFVDCLLTNNGCMIFKVPTQDGQTIILGTRLNPAYAEQINGELSNIVGFNYSLFAETGLTVLFYEPEPFYFNVIGDDSGNLFSDDSGNVIGF